jgi:ABC-type polysaccharide/polyol phosphate export permease
LPGLVAYHFSGDPADDPATRAAFVTWTVGAQAILTAGAFVFVRIILLSARYWSAESTPLKQLLPVMGNMVALPQVIILFAMLDVFLYNSYEIKLIPVLAFAIIVLVLGGAALGAVIMRVFLQARRLYASTNRE